MEMVEHNKSSLIHRLLRMEMDASTKYPIEHVALNWSTKVLPSIYISIITHCNIPLVIIH